MKEPFISSACLRSVTDPLLSKVLRGCGTYYRSGDLFYHELWGDRLTTIGFRVLSVERLYHPVWEVRLRGSLAGQSYLLFRKAIPGRMDGCPQLELKIRNIASDLGPAIKKEFVRVVRNGNYFRANFIWPKGKPGLWIKRQRNPAAVSSVLLKWLRTNRN